MTQDEMVQRNLDLHAEWMRYVFENPDVLDRIPPQAVLVFVPEDDVELATENLKTVDSAKRTGQTVVVIRMKTPRPQVPTIEVTAG
ncbi:MAG: hypothetical protein HY905_24490 [Deltaproteobacteria bacterium]|nr:hypothetical protein [Deltaproteobacteria bacterium]